MELDKCIEVIEEKLEEGMRERGQLLNILDSDKVPKVQIPIKEQKLKQDNQALQYCLSLLKSMKEMSGVVPSIEEIIEIIIKPHEIMRGVTQGLRLERTDPIVLAIAQSVKTYSEFITALKNEITSYFNLEYDYILLYYEGIWIKTKRLGFMTKFIMKQIV